MVGRSAYGRTWARNTEAMVIMAAPFAHAPYGATDWNNSQPTVRVGTVPANFDA